MRGPRYSLSVLLPLLLVGNPDKPSRSEAPPQLVHVPGSTVKLEQLIGDQDRRSGRALPNRTLTRYGIAGADLGASFEHKRTLVLLFGDTIGPGGGDAIAHSTTRDPETGFKLDFYRGGRTRYLRVMPDGELMRGFEVPVGGISVGGVPYLFCKRGHTKGAFTDRTSLVRFDEQAGTFTTVRRVSSLPDGRFIKVSPRVSPPGLGGLPGLGPHVLMWGTGRYRQSSCYLSAVKATELERPGKTAYFGGLDVAGAPRWSTEEGKAAPVVDHPTMGDVSVIWNADLRLWLMTYDSRDPRGIVFRYAPRPWGPWSDAQVIFVARRDGLGRFIHERDSDDGLAGPVIGKGRANPGSVQGGAYAPYMIERFTQVRGGRLKIYFVMSTWNPYVVVLMRSEFELKTLE
jgi:hypothetical protein